jgi:hypothetical protein
MSHTLVGPAPTISVKVAMPMPISVGDFGSARLAACSRRRPS